MWFITHSLDFRVQYVTKVTSLVKSWLYQDQFIEPEEMIMYHPPSYGGLGVQNVKLKAQAGLIKSFLETATSSTFRQSLFHSNLFRYHVLGETSSPNPGFPPFYNKDFFSKIRQVHLETPLNIATMSARLWYALLLEDNCTMEQGTGQENIYIMCRVELTNLDTDWKMSWRLARHPELGPENTSFIFKM